MVQISGELNKFSGCKIYIFKLRKCRGNRGIAGRQTFLWEMEQSSSPVSSDPGLEIQVHGLISEALNYDDLGMPLVLIVTPILIINLECRRHTKSTVRV